MSIPAEFAKQFATFPECLRRLVEAELADGNAILEICGGFPAAPCGDCLKLARQVAACRRESAGGVKFYERNNSDYFGEFTDQDRHFFVLEPPNPPEPEPDMDAIREELEARERAANADRFREYMEVPPSVQEVVRKAEARKKAKAEFSGPPAVPMIMAPGGVVARFVESMKGSLDRWRDGTGYDLALLKSATPEELAAIESILLSRPVQDWCDVEALAALDSAPARVRLREALKAGEPRIATAVAQYAPGLVSDSERTAVLVAAIEGSDVHGGITQALLEIEEFHPPKIVAALLRGALNGDGVNAVHFAAMLMFIHGKAKSSFDWKHRPFFLRFNTEDRAERESAFRELCEKIGVKPERHIKADAGGKAAKGGAAKRTPRKSNPSPDVGR